MSRKAFTRMSRIAVLSIAAVSIACGDDGPTEPELVDDIIDIVTVTSDVSTLQAALQAALVEGRLLGAALDVHAEEGNGNISPLADLPNTILTPHIGATTVDTQKVIGRQIIEAVEQFAD